MHERCLCQRCVPSDVVGTACSRCGAEVRFGYRDGQQGWWHREPVDHFAVLGHLITHETQQRWEAELDLPRTRDDGSVYTTREYMLSKMKKAAREAAEAAGQDPDSVEDVHAIPPPEVRSTPIDVGDERLPGGAKSILTLARKQGFEAWATYARGPRVHGTTQALIEMSDNVVVRARLDDGDKVAVASWWTKNGKPGFEFAYVGTLDRTTMVAHMEPANSKALRAFIKPPDPDPLPLEQETL